MRKAALQWVARLWWLILGPPAAFLWDSIWFWRIVGAIGFSALVLGFCYRERLCLVLRKPEHVKHDLELFLDSDELLTERKLRDILQWVISNRSSEHEKFFQMTRWMIFFNAVENHYLLPRLSSTLEPLLDSMEQLLDFIAYNFNSLQSGASPEFSYLRPDLHPERDGSGRAEEIEQWDEYDVALASRVREVGDANWRYRQAVARTLPEARQRSRERRRRG